MGSLDPHSELSSGKLGKGFSKDPQRDLAAWARNGAQLGIGQAIPPSGGVYLSVMEEETEHELTDFGV